MSSKSWTHSPTNALAALQQSRQKMRFATVAPPVTQDHTGSKGPTAMVFMNMGGPAELDEVGPFLSRLFVSTEKK